MLLYSIILYGNLLDGNLYVKQHVNVGYLQQVFHLSRVLVDVLPMCRAGWVLSSQDCS